MKYTNNFGSTFPNSIIPQSNFKDVDETVASLVGNIRAYVAAEDYASAKALIDANKTLLSDYMLTSEYINLLCEETRNLEIYSLGTSQSTFYTDDVPSEISSKNDVWIGA